jgi:hypothetical protein
MKCLDALDWTPELSDPDDCTGSLDALPSLDILIRNIREVRLYILYWRERDVEKIRALPMTQDERLTLLRFGDHLLYKSTIDAFAREGYHVCPEVMDRIFEALPASLEVIGKDRQWKP